MHVIGLTGGISSGKSTVLKTLEDLGVMVVEVDKTAHLVMEPGQPAWQEIIDFFGKKIIAPNRKINRTVLGEMVFNNPDLLKKLNQITHPRVEEYLQAQLQELRQTKPYEVVVLEVPLLYESGMDKLCDQIWVVWVDYETQIKQLMKRDGLSREDAGKRIAAQMSLDEKARRADLVIDNTGPLEATIDFVTKYYSDFLQRIK